MKVEVGFSQSDTEAPREESSSRVRSDCAVIRSRCEDLLFADDETQSSVFMERETVGVLKFEKKNIFFQSKQL